MIRARKFRANEGRHVLFFAYRGKQYGVDRVCSTMTSSACASWQVCIDETRCIFLSLIYQKPKAGMLCRKLGMYNLSTTTRHEP